MKVIEIDAQQEEILHRLGCGQVLNSSEKRELLFFLEYLAACRSDGRLNNQGCTCKREWA